MNACYFLFPTGSDHFYVGSSSNVKKRITRHKYDLKRSAHHNSRLQKMYDECGGVTEKIIIFRTIEEARALEQKTLDENRDNELMLNVGLSVSGGDNLTRNPSKVEIINKIRLGSIKKHASRTKEERLRLFSRPGERNGMYGKTHTPEVRKRLSEHSTGRPSPLKGKPMPDERYAKFMKFVAQRDYNGEKNPFYGRKHSAETRAKLAEASRGRVPPNITPVLIHDKRYNSLAEAGRALGVPVPTVLYRVRSDKPKWVEWNYAS